MGNSQDAALLLGESRVTTRASKQYRGRYCERANVSLHSICLLFDAVRKSAIGSLPALVGSRVRGNVPKVITYRIGGIAAVLAQAG
jgi:hypothetical protein